MIRLMAAALAMVATQAAQGQDVPELRKGIWDLKKVINGRPYDVRRCMDPFADLIRQHTELSASGCSFKVIKKAQMHWEIHSECKKTNSEGRRWESNSVSAMKIESETSYKMEVKGTTNTVPMQESVVARWAGNCSE